MKPKFAITMGDPAGVGPEIILKAWKILQKKPFCFYGVGDYQYFQTLAKQYLCEVEIVKITHITQVEKVFAKGLPIFDIGKCPAKVVLGKGNPANGKIVCDAVQIAANHVMAGDASAMVTAPLSKEICRASGFAFAGHTEYLASLAGKSSVTMLFAGPELCVAPLTIHIPLKQVFAKLDSELIITQAHIIDHAFKTQFHIAKPILAMAGLNPHAGENRLLGNEEHDIIIPALEILRMRGIDIRGPFAADSLFSAQMRSQYDVALACYHDQALIAAKALDMAQTVNITLGLDFIRTSPDHGTAFDLAAQFRADPSSMIAAISYANKLVQSAVVKEK